MPRRAISIGDKVDNDQLGRGSPKDKWLALIALIPCRRIERGKCRADRLKFRARSAAAEFKGAAGINYPDMPARDRPIVRPCPENIATPEYLPGRACGAPQFRVRPAECARSPRCAFGRKIRAVSPGCVFRVLAYT